MGDFKKGKMALSDDSCASDSGDEYKVSKKP
jgi:hypothetical protein